MFNELTENQCFVFLHSKDDQQAWDGDAEFTRQVSDWWKTTNLQEFGNKQIELTMAGLVYRPVIMELKPEQLSNGKWAVAIHFYDAELKMEEESAE